MGSQKAVNARNDKETGFSAACKAPRYILGLSLPDGFELCGGDGNALEVRLLVNPKIDVCHIGGNHEMLKIG
jgi:hypothetical protein